MLYRAKSQLSQVATIAAACITNDGRTKIIGGDRRIRLVFLIRSLAIGGAERQLVDLAKGLNKQMFDVTVLCFYGGGEFAEELDGADVTVLSLDKKGRWDILGFFSRLLIVLRKLKPDLLHSYMTGSNLVATLLKPGLSATRLVWGVEAAYIDLSRYGWLEQVTSRAERLLSCVPDLIIFNSFAGRDYHLSAGFTGSHTRVIHNGIDTKRFAPDAKSGSRARASWRIPQDAFVIGIVGRLDPMKDHPTFLRAAAIFARDNPDVRFVCVGGGPEEYSLELRALSQQLDLADKVAWPGFVRDTAAAYNALNICCSSSYGEGTSNAIAEAMACGVPCVVTDVGDSGLIVGDTGIVVPPKNPEALAEGWTALIERMRETPRLRHEARERIEQRLSLSGLVRNTSKELLNLL
jgi:glycosyltransferase involved in cell wall biosynthesis